VNPFVVTVTELLKHPGTQRPTVATGPLDGVELTAVRVPPGAPISFDGVLECIADRSITATGTIRAPWVGECRRCLREVAGELVADIQEVFTTVPVEGETYRLDHDRVDLEPMVRDAVLLALPLAPLCEGSCAGPDPVGHPVAVEEDEDEGEPPDGDPRWSKLSELRFD
jgi:uncharacterized protein